MSRERQRGLRGAVVGLLAGAVVIGLVFLIVQTYGLASSIREGQKVNLRTNALIASCVTPEGKCFKDGEERTGRAVENIGLLSIYAAACADTPGVQGAPAIEACVRRLLEENS